MDDDSVPTSSECLSETARRVFDEAFEEAKMRGLCVEGAREYAVGRVRQMDESEGLEEQAKQ